MEEITLKQLLLYYDPDHKPVDRIQVVSWKSEWGRANELAVDSELLEPILNCRILMMKCTQSYIDRKPVLKVLIDKQ